MTPEDQRIAIAETCGWKFDRRLPDYLNDLNAMHEAEKTLYGIQTHFYALRLRSISVLYSAVHATAAQRAEAFLRTIGKWKQN